MKKRLLPILAILLLGFGVVAYYKWVLPSNNEGERIQPRSTVNNLLSTPEQPFTTSYYVSNSSGGSNQGTQANPWTSLASINWSTVAAGGRDVKLKAGDTFNETMTITSSGSSGSQIHIGTYGSGAAPIISGFETVSSWSSIGGNNYEATLAGAPSSLNMVTVNGVFQPIGRYPKLSALNSGYITFQSHTGNFTVSPATGTTITSDAISGLPSFVGGEVVIRSYHYNINRGTITAQSSTVVTYTDIPGTHTTNPPTDGDGFFFQNDIDCLTTLGDWCYNGSTHKITMNFGGNNPNSYTVKAAVRGTVVDASSRTYLKFDSLSFQGSNSKTIDISSADSVIFNACDFKFAGVYGIFCNSSTIRTSLLNSTVNYTNNNFAEGRSSTYWTITGNTINHTASIAGMGVSGDGQYNGLNEIGTNSYISDNVITNTGYMGIQMTSTGPDNSTNASTIQRNFVDTFCFVKDDGGGIYSQGTGPTKFILYNIVTNGLGASDGTADGYKLGHGIYIDDNAAGFSIMNNTAANNSGIGVYIHNASRIVMWYNTCYNNGTNDALGGGASFSDDNSGGPISSVSANNNVYFAKLDNQMVMRIVNPTSVISWDGFNRNYYCRPVNERDFIVLNVGGPTQYKTLAAWKSFSGKDGVSKGSPLTVSSTSKLRFEYNATQSNTTVALGSTIYKSAKGQTFTGNVTLLPFTSLVLINTQ